MSFIPKYFGVYTLRKDILLWNHKTITNISKFNTDTEPYLMLAQYYNLSPDS